MVLVAMGKIFAATLSIVLGLAIAELGASLLHGGAYPYLNLFEPSEHYGVVLEKDAATKVRTRTGRRTTIRTNSAGFRGEEWRGGDKRVLLLGDSQAMGFNVEERDAFASKLDGTVYNVSVPTWGPHEYVEALAEYAPLLHPTHVVVIINAANDWFEAPVPNVRRTRAQDGFARYKDLTTAPPANFAGRRWLLGRSHLVLAMRQLWQHAMGTPPAESAELLLETKLEGRMSAHLLRARDLCAQHGCHLVVAALPLDVQVHAAEWNKYRGRALDMQPTEHLGASLVAQAEALGVIGVDLLPILRAASPGAFLDDDYHLSPKGHDAVALALRAFL